MSITYHLTSRGGGAPMTDIRTLLAGGALMVRLARAEKRPLGAGWQDKATTDADTVAGWLRSGSGVGLLLGPASGLVDVEFDEPAGREALERLGVLDILTPTWRSARGEHRLFRWEPALPPVAFLHAGPVEVRIGGRAAQSVLPPSRHPSGIRYEWTVPPTEVPVATLPPAILDEVLACAAAR